MKKIYSLLVLCTLILLTLTPHAYANDVLVYDYKEGDPTTTTYLPIAINNSAGANDNNGRFSVSQQLYYASELEGASSTTINAITFYYTSGTSFTRKLRVWMSNTALNNFPVPDGGEPANKTPYMVAPGTKVFSGDVVLTAGYPYTITFDNPYVWDGESNIIVTVFDSTGIKNSSLIDDPTRKGGVAPGATEMFGTPETVRFLHKTYNATADFADAGWTMDNLAAAKANSSTVANRRFVNKITFTFAAAAVPPAVPSDLAASSVGITTASLSWSAVDGAKSYKLSYSADGTIYSELATPSTNSYDWTGLTANTTYYVKVAAVNDEGDSELSDPISFTTLVPHIHDDISFEPWFNPSTLPTSGNYYISSNMNFDAYTNDVITLTGDLNLCLNGKTVNMEASRFVVPSGKTLTIYDNVGGGKLTSFVASEVGAFEDDNTALIVVKSGGTLVLKEGAIENSYDPDEEGSSYAIYSNGTLRMAGAPSISSKAVDIYLSAAGVITMDGALSNSEKYSVMKYSASQITSGWGTHMSGEKPRDFFLPAEDSHIVSLNAGGEAQIVSAITLADNVDNSSTISAKEGIASNFIISRSFTSASYNTICLPFPLDDDQLEDVFGEDYDLEKFYESSLDGDALDLMFVQAHALEAGKPYLIRPSVDVVNPGFVGVTIGITSPNDQTSDTYISFHGTFAPTPVTGGDKNTLFLGAGNELFYPASDANIKGFRAYFEVKGGAAKAAKRARIVKQENTATGIDNQELKANNQKLMKDGQLLIIRDNKTYNVLGQMVK